MKVYEQGNALIDALAEQYGAEDLPDALGDVLYQMLVRAADKGAGGHDLHEMLTDVTDRWGDRVNLVTKFDEQVEIAFDRAYYGDSPFGPFSVNGAASSEGS